MKGFFLIFCALVFAGCTNDETFCTEEFRLISVTVTGSTLDSARTVRLATNDTLDYTLWNDPPTSFVVADDNLTAALQSITEDFLFLGFRDTTLVISQVYRLTSDGCHVSKVAGPDTIQL